ncbi:cutinase family protein [Corynebacterium accolens]|uniref:cutinase family protein n=1 Tax=Corynebacterium accolens TaxID=38284 RepID=UPI001EDC85DA
MNLLKHAFSYAATASIVAMFGLSVPTAVAQETENKDVSDDKCADIQLVLVNGTFDTSAQEDSTHDHGFGSKIAGPAMREANPSTPKDLSGGISLEDAEESSDSSAESTPSATSTKATAEAVTKDNAQMIAADSKDLWGDSDKSTGDKSGDSNDLWGSGDSQEPAENKSDNSDLWGNTDTSSGKSSDSNDQWGSGSKDSATDFEDEESSDSLWEDAPENNTDEWQTEEKDTVEKDGTRIARTYVTYPAAAGGAIVPGLKPSAPVAYTESMEKGAQNTAKVLNEVAAKCPNTKVFLAGHSQGAQVASTVAREIGSGESDFPADKVAGVALFSDPTRDKGVQVMQGGESTPAAVPDTDGDHTKQVGEFSSPEQDKLDGAGMGLDKTGGKGFGELADRTASWCSEGDLVCDLPVSGRLSDLVVGTAERLDLHDPEESLQAVSDTLGPAVQLGGLDDVKDDGIDFGDGGFKVESVSDNEVPGLAAAPSTDNSASSANETPSAAPSTSAQSETSSQTSTPTSATEETESSANASETASSGQSGNVDLISTISRDGARSKSMAEARGPVGGELIGDLGKSAVAAVSKLGGMALGKGITIAKKAITVENLAQVASAGITNPKAGLAVAASKLADAALEVLTPETVTGMADEVFKEIDVLGITGDGLAETAVQAAGHGNAHNSYGSRPATADGRSAIDATVDWAVASSRDVAGDEVRPDAVQNAGLDNSTYSADEAKEALDQVTNFKKELMG